MNSELSAAGEARIIVPTLYREQYLDCLRELNGQHAQNLIWTQ
jgi:hypothetical protein